MASWMAPATISPDVARPGGAGQPDDAGQPGDGAGGRPARPQPDYWPGMSPACPGRSPGPGGGVFAS